MTGATALTGLSAQPYYLLEGIRKTPPGSGDTFYYRITTRAQGVNLNTVVWLQEVFKP
jgi:type IV pilus assembly protein PilX